MRTYQTATSTNEKPPFASDPFLKFLESIACQHIHIFPKSGNAGDGFISYATYELFKRYGIAFTTHKQGDTVEGETVLIGGGGNLIEGRYDDVAELIRRHATNNRVVLLPHTIVGFADVLAETHKNLTVFCREPVSYRLALLNGANEDQTFLSHDVVFFLEDEHFREFFQRGRGILRALRQDGETAGSVPLSPENIDISLSWNGDIWTSAEFSKHSTKSMAAFIATHAVVQTDRLHVSILSAFLRKRVYLLPNAYYKNRAIYEHSMLPRFADVEFINTLSTIGEVLPDVSNSAQLQQAEQLSQTLEAVTREVTLREKAEHSLALLKQEWREHLRVAQESREAMVNQHVLDCGGLRMELDRICRELDTARHQRKLMNHQLDEAHQDAALSARQSEMLLRDLETVLGSTSWRILRPIRAIGARIPESIRALLRRTLIPRVKTLASPSVPVEDLPLPSSDEQIVQQANIEPASKLKVVWIGGEPNTPGYRYRVLYWADAARTVGCSVSHYGIDEFDSYIETVASANIVILWRAAWDDRVEAIASTVRENRAKLIFDVDDLMIDLRIVDVEFIDGIRSQSLTTLQVREHFARMHRTMMAADLCLATTKELASHYRVMQKPALVMPNGFSLCTFRTSRLAARSVKLTQPDGLFRIGYASGSRTHQKDFSICAPAVASLLREQAHARLVLFRDKSGTTTLDLHEFPELCDVMGQIEWREMVPLPDLPKELARFDVNLAPLEIGNFFCEAKSELKYFEAALVEVPTIASPTGPYRRIIEHGVTGFLAHDEADWRAALATLVSMPVRRRQTARNALRDVLWKFGPDRRVDLMASMLDMAVGGRSAARAFAYEISKRAPNPARLHIPESEVIFEHDRLVQSDVTVIVPLYNYEQYVEEALNSVATQTLDDIDLIIVDDASTDASLTVATEWVKSNKDRFNRLFVLRNRKNSKLGPTRNVGFDAAETPYVLTLDADNKLYPHCAEQCLDVIKRTGAAYIYPKICAFGDADYVMGESPYDPVRFIGGNYIDAMALISKGVWSGVGGYESVPYGWEDYEFWCKIAELGLIGVSAGEKILAGYRVHKSSMLHQHTNVESNREVTSAYLHNCHPWLEIAKDDIGNALQKRKSKE
ncbi:exopolysaccharide biosynthesis predicted pyruvyl transferase EpsI/glycosyltransferase involved in cell wall biosynthesis [Paraburkholderia sp. GAS33]|uniref:glycosyltransferase n=1 Tax=Paraburkholderia sp. GAS33 TaxID=3035130 RepID=UPI003D1B85E2